MTRNDIELSWRAKDKELFLIRNRIEASMCYHPQFDTELQALLDFEIDENLIRQDSFSN
jgi:hypothetical protein